ncbi:ComF family protein [Streptomyces sp. NRRL F-5065]|uniref:ComF family protein n=1 Tax=Streptomyces sp. NRRL F-5065 TaxID=1463855 RepID=UPI0004C15C6C|nr:ComF family protein [Streptomyces sp. NRRL F-5065]
MWTWWRDLLDLVLPAECGGCGGARTVLCAPCRAALGGAAPRRVRPSPEPPGLPPVHAVAPYADEVRAVLLAHKERGALTLAGPLGTALAGAVGAALADAGGEAPRAARAGPGGPAPGREAVRVRAGPVLLVPVPSARKAVAARGHDPARRIALAAAGELRRGGTPARVLTALRQRRAVADQSGLGARERRRNLAGALAVAPGAVRSLEDAGVVVLVDDLMTTGATLAEAARAVRAAMGPPGPAVPRRAAGAGRGPLPATYAGVGGGGEGEGFSARAGRARGRGGSAVYPPAAGEGREQRTKGPVRTVPHEGGDAIRRTLHAAVVASSPDSFEINRN